MATRTSSRDALAHLPSPNTPLLVQGDKLEFAYHAWLSVPGSIIDFTTFQLRKKALIADVGDGSHTTVTWCPDFLILPQSSVVTGRELLAKTTPPGAAYYERNLVVESLVKNHETIDHELIQIGTKFLARPHVQVFTPYYGWVRDPDNPE